MKMKHSFSIISRKPNTTLFRGDKTAGLKAHMDAFIDARVKDWNDSHPNSGVMTRKEFLSRALMNGKEGSVCADRDRRAYSWYYVLSVCFLDSKADGTYTTEPSLTQFTTVADQVTLASLEFIVMSYGYPEENRNMYRVWTYANNSKGTIFSRLSERTSGLAKTASEVRELLKASSGPVQAHTKWTHNSDRLGMAIRVAMTRREFPRKSINFGNTSPADTGDSFDII